MLVPSCDRDGDRQGSEYLLLYRDPSGNCCAQPFVCVTELNGAVQAEAARMGSLGMFKKIGRKRKGEGGKEEFTFTSG